MKHKRIFQLLSLFMILILMSFLFWEHINYSNQKEKKIVSLHVYIINTVRNEEQILKAFNDGPGKEMGIKVELTNLPSEQYRRNLTNILDIQQNADIVFDAPWLNMSQNISRGAYLNLTDYIESGKYTGLSSAFSARYLTDNKMNGGLYGLPVTKVFYDIPGIVYRKDLLKQYNLGFDEIQTLEQLEKYYIAVQEHSPDMIPLSVEKRGFFRTLFPDELILMKNGVYEITGASWPNLPAYVVLSEDNTKVENVIFLGDDASQFPKGAADYLKEAYLKQAKWNSYLSADSIMSPGDASELLSGKAASYENTLGDGTLHLEQELQKTIPEAELGFYAANTSLQGDLKNLKISKGLTAWNYVCIPENSLHVEESLLFLDWLFASQENNDLFTLGIEGFDWISSDKKHEFKLNEQNDERYSFPAYALSYNPYYLRYEEGLNENEKNWILAMSDEKNFIGSPMTGFSADFTGVQTEYNALLDLYDNYHVQFMHGTYGEETETKIWEFHNLAENLGLETIRQHLITQIQNHLDACSYSQDSP